MSIDTIAVDPIAPTGTVAVELDAQGNHHFTIHTHVAWDQLTADAAALSAAQGVDAICFGTLGQRCAAVREAIQTLVRATPAAALRVLDINLRQDFSSPEVIRQSLTLANVLKLNTDELENLSPLLNLSGTTAERLEQLADRFDLRLVALTRGPHGSMLVSAGTLDEHDGFPVTLRDSIGAGDAFAAAMTLGFLSGWSLSKINRWANETAAEVCSHFGAFAPLPSVLRECFRELTGPVITLPAIAEYGSAGA